MQCRALSINEFPTCDFHDSTAQLTPSAEFRVLFATLFAVRRTLSDGVTLRLSGTTTTPWQLEAGGLATAAGWAGSEGLRVWAHLG